MTMFPRRSILSLLLISTQLVTILNAQNIWSYTYDGGARVICTDLIVCSDQTYLVSGYTHATWSIENAWAFKLDVEGNLVWDQRFSNGTGNDQIHSSLELADSTLIFLGTTRPNPYVDGHDMWLCKADESGDTLWTRRYNLGGMDIGREILPAPDNSFFLLGNSYTEGYPSIPDVWLIRVDASGDSLWARKYEENFEISSATINVDGSVVLAGTLYDDLMIPGAGIMRIGAEGQLIAKRSYSGANPSLPFECRFHHITGLREGGYLLTGYGISGSTGGTEFWSVKTDEVGDILWTWVQGANAHQIYQGYSSIEIGDNQGFACVGYSYSMIEGKADYYMARLDASGDSLWTRTFSHSHYGEAKGIVPGIDGGFLITGTILGPWSGDNDVWIIKTDEEGRTVDQPVRIASSSANQGNGDVLIFPNPTNQTANFRYSIDQPTDVVFTVVDLRGRTVWSEELANVQAGTYHSTWTPGGNVSGIYFVRIETENHIYNQKFTVIK